MLIIALTHYDSHFIFDQIFFVAYINADIKKDCKIKAAGIIRDIFIYSMWPACSTEKN